jgi:protein CpxP
MGPRRRGPHGCEREHDYEVRTLAHRHTANEKPTIALNNAKSNQIRDGQVMNEPYGRFTHVVRTIAAAAVLLIITFAAAPAVAAESSNAVRAEAHITEMHAKLKITAAEEGQWVKVAAVLRDNAKKLDELTSARIANATTAVEHVNSYGVIAYAHADGIKRFAPVFAGLYASMPDAQKAQANELFGHESFANRL